MAIVIEVNASCGVNSFMGDNVDFFLGAYCFKLTLGKKTRKKHTCFAYVKKLNDNKEYGHSSRGN